MSVTGYLALYTTLLGWQQYQNLWGIACSTGLVYLPFIGIFISSVIEPFTSMGAKDASQIAVRRLLINTLSALLVITIAAVPCVNLNPKVLHFEPLCENSQPVTPGHTGTTYDNVFPVPTGVKVPLLWYLVMAFSNGFTHAANVGLGCTPINYRVLHDRLNLAKIADPQLQKETARFYNECYVPAYSTYMGNMSDTQKTGVQQYLNKYGQKDVGWLGSQTFLHVGGFYDSLRALSPVSGFLFDPKTDIEDAQIANHSKWGSPSCQNWWLDSVHGLRMKLIKALPNEVNQQIDKIGSNTPELENTAIRTLITNSNLFSNFLSTSHAYESLDDNTHGTGSFISKYIGAPLGIGIESLSFFPKLHLIINALPVIQASILFALYTFLALAIVFSSFRIRFCVLMSAILFSVIFFSFLWHLVAWFDHFLIQALYPSFGTAVGMEALLPAAVNVSASEAFVNMIIGTMYMALPIFWLIVMGWAGHAAGHYMQSAVNSLANPTDAASSNVKSSISKRIG